MSFNIKYRELGNHILTNINTNIYNIQDFELQNSITQELSTAKKNSDSQANNNTEATKVEVSETLKTEFSKVLSKEDLIVEKMNSAQTIYDSLTNIRLELAGMLKILRDKDLTDSVEKIKELDSQSNALIDKTINVIKNNDRYGLIDSQYLNTFFKGMNSLKILNLNSENYLDKITSIMNGVKTNQDKYGELTEALYNEFINNSEKYLKNNTTTENDSKKLSKLIFSNYNEALYDSMSKLTPEVVQRLLENK